jgi:predicted AAA+ superfamily ATPase
MGNTKTLQREISALHEANNELKPANAIVLTWQEEDHGRSDGICILPVWKWLLDYATITETTT